MFFCSFILSHPRMDMQTDRTTGFSTIPQLDNCECEICCRPLILKLFFGMGFMFIYFCYLNAIGFCCWKFMSNCGFWNFLMKIINFQNIEKCIYRMYGCFSDKKKIKTITFRQLMEVFMAKCQTITTPIGMRRCV